MRAIALRTILALALLVPASVAVTPAPAEAFTGHRCRIATCKFFTSSHSSARFFYNRTTCDQWKDLSRKYLHGFRTKRALKNRFPNRRLHAPC